MRRLPRLGTWALAVSFAAALVGSCKGELAAPDAGADASACTSGSIHFRLLSTSPETYCVGAPNTCTSSWLWIRNEAGDDLAIDRPCVADCASCEPIGCPAYCAVPTRMRSSGEERTWDGTYWATATCGSDMTCVNPACAAAGHYFARMCAYRDPTPDAGSSSCSPVDTPTCVEVPFDWPPTDPSRDVEGLIQDDSTEKCCPTTWWMYACTYTDAGAGFNCHNPALKCASSSVCDDSCDFVVARRCGE